ncbi:helix-turn-helix domain-containing protein [Ornithinibacillus contaminans]|uniref:helix-turn-helix domain-containing protein n=1 Tax=Ornithinibacillus contaminans TaxID=694055 RepID=UPI00064D7E63|nr:helix-turn-helix domain-containing protein [Ornithinibacillus contaminans]
MYEGELKINIEYLKAYKKKHSLTNRALAEKVGVHESSVSRVLRNKNGIGFKFISGVVENVEDLDLNKLLKVRG